MNALLKPVFASILMMSWALSAQAGLPLKDGEGRELPSLAPLVKEVRPAVVNIATFATQKVQQNPLLNDPFFRRFFNVPPQQRQAPRKTQSAGSGVIIDAAKGTVVTNHHVIEGADEIKVSLSDGRTYTATLLGSDPDVDIAVLKIEAEDLRELKLADSEQLESGDFVIAVGNPFGLGHSVTTGVVSALGRSGLGIENYENFIQTDASINPGNSGGALVNLRGELTGINTAIIGPAGGNVGIGFAIPSNMAKASIDQILEHGEVRRGQLGVIIQNLTPDLAEAFGIDPQQKGVLIADVQKGSAAEKAKLRAGDVVTAVDDKKVESSSDLRNAIGLRRIGERLKLSLLRDGKTLQRKVTIGSPDEVAQQNDKPVHPLLAGAVLENTEDGVTIASVEPGSRAAAYGLRKGDIIAAANRYSLSTVDELRKLAKQSDARLLLRVKRGGRSLYMVLQ